jgi:hypothetical protein
MKYTLTAIALLLCLSGFSQPNGKNILMEYITSAGCPGCAWGNYVRDSVLQYQDNAIFVAIHRADVNHPDSMGCADADSVLSEYLWAHPTSMVDRILWDDFPRVSLTSNQWDTKIALRNQDPVVATVGGTTVYDSATRNLSVTVNGFILWNREHDIRVNAYIVEDSVNGNGVGFDQLNGNNNSPTSPLFGLGDPIPNYYHRYVLRDMLAGHHGLAGVIPNPVSSGSPFSHTFTTTLNPNWNADKVYVVVVVQRHDPDPLKREIYNCNRIELNSSVLASSEEPSQLLPENPRFELYPNPVLEEATLKMIEFDEWNIEMLDMTGRVLKRYRLLGDQLRINTSQLSGGSYTLKISRDKSAPHTIRFLVR